MPPTISPMSPRTIPVRTPLDAFAGTKRGLLEHLHRLHAGIAAPAPGLTRLQAIDATCGAVVIVREAERAEGIERSSR